MDIDDIVNEIENFGFHLEGKYTVRLIHNGNYGDGTVLNFRKGGTLAVAFGTDDGERLNDSHFGSAKFFHIYRFHDGNAELVEMRENIKIEEAATRKRQGQPPMPSPESMFLWAGDSGPTPESMFLWAGDSGPT